MPPTSAISRISGGQLYIEHGGSPQRLKSTTVRTLIVDELDEFAANLKSGDDPVAMLDGRTSAFPAAQTALHQHAGHRGRVAHQAALPGQRSAPLPTCHARTAGTTTAGMGGPALEPGRHPVLVRVPRVRRLHR